MVKLKSTMMLIVMFLTVSAFSLTPEEIIEKVDENNLGRNQRYSGKLTITKGKRKLIKNFFGYGRNEDFYMEFTNPEDLGVKYLKMEDELWIYFPDADDVIKITGNMLRQGMMGSDISYEDMVKMDSIQEKYDAVLKDEEKYNERDCYKIELTAKKNVKDITYYKEVLLIDKEWFVILKAELYAKSGRLLKTMRQSNIKKVDDRYISFSSEIQDMRRKNSITIMELTELSFNIQLPKNLFSKQYLYR